MKRWIRRIDIEEVSIAFISILTFLFFLGLLLSRPIELDKTQQKHSNTQFKSFSVAPRVDKKDIEYDEAFEEYIQSELNRNTENY